MKKLKETAAIDFLRIFKLPAYKPMFFSIQQPTVFKLAIYFRFNWLIALASVFLFGVGGLLIPIFFEFMRNGLAALCNRFLSANHRLEPVRIVKFRVPRFQGFRLAA